MFFSNINRTQAAESYTNKKSQTAPKTEHYAIHCMW